MDFELIPAVCPNCGGKLQVDPNADTLTCQFCSTEHIIRRNVSGEVTLEAYARCPLCKRNDQAEKASAILNKQISQSEHIEARQQVYTDMKGRAYTRTVNVPVQTVQASNLAQRLTPPCAPNTKSQNWPVILLLLFGILFFVLGSCCSLSGILGLLKTSLNSSDFGTRLTNLFAYGFLPFFLSVGLFFLWNFSRRKEKERLQLEQIDINDAYKRWQYAKSRWDKLYYCGRDDVVFIPGEKISAPINDMFKLIYAIHPAT